MAHPKLAPLAMSQHCSSQAHELRHLALRQAINSQFTIQFPLEGFLESLPPPSFLH